jgi:hypothetical protein
MAKERGQWPAQTRQEKFVQPGENVDTVPSNAVPRSHEFDLMPTMSRTRIGAWGDEQTHTVGRRGNKVTEGKNY